MQKPRLSFIHGFMGHSSDWQPVRSLLGEFESYAVDIAPASNWDASIDTLVQRLPERTILVGYSMGARLALGVALEAPEKFDGLVFVSGNPGIRDDRERTKRFEFDKRIAERIETECLEEFLQHWYDFPVFGATPKGIREAEIERKKKQDWRLWPEIIRCNSIAQQPNYWTRLEELSMPLLAVAGQDDEKYAQIALQMVELASEASSHILPSCGHIVHREHPDAFGALLLKFIEKHCFWPDC